jgi:hypothetical protein
VRTAYAHENGSVVLDVIERRVADVPVTLRYLKQPKDTGERRTLMQLAPQQTGPGAVGACACACLPMYVLLPKVPNHPRPLPPRRQQRLGSGRERQGHGRAGADGPASA